MKALLKANKIFRLRYLVILRSLQICWQFKVFRENLLPVPYFVNYKAHQSRQRGESAELDPNPNLNLSAIPQPDLNPKSKHQFNFGKNFD